MCEKWASLKDLWAKIRRPVASDSEDCSLPKAWLQFLAKAIVSFPSKELQKAGVLETNASLKASFMYWPGWWGKPSVLISRTKGLKSCCRDRYFGTVDISGGLYDLSMLLGWNLLTMYCRILRFYHQNGLFKEICCISCSLCQGRHARVMFCRKLDGGNCWHYMLALSLGSFGKSGIQGASFSLGPKRWPKLGTKDSVLRCQESQIHIYI